MTSNTRPTAWRSFLFAAVLCCADAATAGTVMLRDGKTVAGAVRFEGTDVLVVAADGGAETRLPLAQVARVWTRDPDIPAARPAPTSDDPAPGRTAAGQYPRKPAHRPAGGIRAEYFADRAMTDRRLARREENLLHTWPAGEGPDPDVPAHFAARWAGRFQMPAYEEAKVRSLFLEFDGGVRFWLDGELKLDTWDSHPQGSHARYELEAGRAYDFKLEYWHGGGAGRAQLLMTTIDRQRTRALKGWYFSPPAGDGEPPEVEILSPDEGGAGMASETLAVEAAAHDADGSAARVRFYDNGIPAGTADRPPYRLVIERPTPGPHTLTARATDARGLSATSAPVTYYVAADPTAGATGAAGADGRPFDPARRWGVVGVVPPAEPARPINKGGAIDPEALLPRVAAPTTLPVQARVAPEGGAVTLTCAGGGLQGEADAFGCVFTEAGGDFRLTARLASLDCESPDAMPLAGLAVQADFRPDAPRLSLVAGTTPDRPAVLQLNRDRHKTPDADQALVKRPVWLRLTRAGRIVRTETSEDGRKWSPVGRAQTSLPGRLRVGLVACTRDPKASVTATFDHVTLAPWRETFTYESAGVLLVDGSFLDESIAPLAGAVLTDADLGLRPPGRPPLALARVKVARVLFAPLATEVAESLPGDAAGVLLVGGDFLEGAASLDGGRVTVESVLFGKRTLRAKTEAAAILLNGGPPHTTDAPFVVTTASGSGVLANSLRARGKDLVIDEPEVGALLIAQSAVVEVRARPAMSAAGASRSSSIPFWKETP